MNEVIVCIMDGEKFDPIVILMQGLSTAVGIEEGRSLAEAEGLFFMVTFSWTR